MSGSSIRWAGEDGAAPPGGSERIAVAVHRLRAGGNRRTVLRTSLITLLGSDTRHWTGAELCEAMIGTGLPVDYSTILRTLGDLAEMRVACIVRTSRVRRFGLRHPAHHHAVCAVCDLVVEVPADRLRTTTRTLETASGLDLDDGQILLTGRCPACRRRANP